jgi:hypothetical protein
LPKHAKFLNVPNGAVLFRQGILLRDVTSSWAAKWASMQVATATLRGNRPQRWTKPSLKRHDEYTPMKAMGWWWWLDGSLPTATSDGTHTFDITHFCRSRFGFRGWAGVVCVHVSNCTKNHGSSCQVILWIDWYTPCGPIAFWGLSKHVTDNPIGTFRMNPTGNSSGPSCAILTERPQKKFLAFSQIIPWP